VILLPTTDRIIPALSNLLDYETYLRIEHNLTQLNAYRSARDSKPLEVVGTYNPLPQKPTNLSEEEAKVAKAFKEISIDRSRVKYWLGVGAQPTDSVWRLLSMVRRYIYSFCWVIPGRGEQGESHYLDADSGFRPRD
jgi:ribosomal protein S16